MKDPGGTPATTTGTAPPQVPAGSNPDPTGFRFNLDDALARLSEPHQPIPRFKWSAVTPSEPSTPSGPLHATTLAAPPAPPAPSGPGSVGSTFPDQVSRARPLTQPTLDPLPEIREATAIGGNPAAAHWSTVPVDVPPPVTPPSSFPVPAVVNAAPGAAPMVVTGSEAFAAGAFGFTPDPDYAPGPVGLRDNSHVDGGMPRLPDSDPAAAPPMATMVSSTQNHIPAAKSSAAVKGRKKRKRNRFGKVVLVLVLLAGLVGGALMFGRDYLFPEDWNKDVVPAVEALQLRSGLEFADPVPVITLPETEYAAKVAGAMFGPGLGTEWLSSVPRWRALGLVDGEPTLESVNGVVSAWMPAFYDPADGHIYRTSSGTASTASTVALRDALAAALVHQLGGDSPAPAPVADPSAPAVVASATDSLARLAVDDFGAEVIAGSTTPDPDRSAFAPLPVPLAHRLIGVDDLGAPIVASLGGVADRAGAITGFDVDVTGVLDVPWTAAPVPALIAGDTQDGAAAARGGDFWYTVLAAYLPADTAADAADSIGADLYSPAIRGAQQCVYGTFTAASPDSLGVLQISLIAWAELAPTQAGASATTLADGVTVQLVTCDPGTGPDATRAPDVAAGLIARQLARLAGA